MGTAKKWLAILVLLVVPSYDAFPYDYTWIDYRAPFTQLVKVPAYTSGTSTVYLDLPEDLINSREELTLNLDLESNILLKIDGLEQKTFEKWSAYCSVNGAMLFWKHRLRVNDLPARQTCSIVIATKDLKAGKNTLEFSMSPTGANVNWSGIYGKMVIAYGIHRMWFSGFSAPSQESTVQKAKDVPVDKTSPNESVKKPKQELAAAISGDKRPEVVERIKLRDKGESNFDDQDLQKMIKERNFFNKQFNPGGQFPNAFVDNENGTVTDKVTGLMWEKGGSPSEMSFYAAGKYLDELNSIRFGGYGDWRLPTMEELCSLLEGTPNKSGKYIDNLFDLAQGICWSADGNRRYSGTRVPLPIKAVFGVNFIKGETSIGNAERFQPTNESQYYVRAVRTAE